MAFAARGIGGLLLMLAVAGNAYALAPTATTVSATNIVSSGSNSSALLNGSGNPDGESTTGYFRYDVTSPGSCNDTFGTRVPATSGTSLGPGNTVVNYSISAANLIAGTTYYFCAITNNASGTAFGSIQSFTIPYLPVVTTQPQSSVMAFSATLNGTVNPTAATTSAWFRYDTTNPNTCNNTFGTATTALNEGAGTVNLNYSTSVPLQPNVTYYYCAIAQNSYGFAYGAIVAFTTPAAAPSTFTSPANGFSDVGATLNGGANPEGAATTGWFRYAATSPGTCNDTFGTRVPATGGTPLGSADVSSTMSQPITGLTPGMTYYFCAVASNSVGTTFGNVYSFTTLPDPPTVTTNPASGTTSTATTLNSTVNPNGGGTTTWFRYDTTNPVTCNDTFGTRTSSSATLTGNAALSYAQSVAGLLPGVTYYFCAIASNSAGTALGAVLNFSTPPMAPTITTNSSSGVTATGATISGAANPNGAATTAWFRYGTVNPVTCNDTFGTRIPGTGGTVLPAGNTNTAYSQTLSGLTQGVTYYYCAIGSNSAGTSVGTVYSFTTPAPPTVTTLTATGVSNNSATLQGSGNPNLDVTTAWFRYDTINPVSCNDTFGARTPTTGGTNLGSGSNPISFSGNISGLLPLTTYYYCAIDSNPEGTAYGAVLSFTTQAPPSVTTLAQSNLAPYSATLNSSVNPNGNATTAYFRYDLNSPGTCNTSFGTSTATGSMGNGTGAVSYSVGITGLTPTTTYYYCAIGFNSWGTTVGQVLSFTTPPAAPSTYTSSPSGTTSSAFTMNGGANPEGAATTGWFRYDTVNPGTCNDTFGTRVPSTGGTNLGSGLTSASMSQLVSGLGPPGTTYYYCAIASNSVGTTFGGVQPVTLLPAPPTVTTNAATLVLSTSATLNGSVNPNGGYTTAWFRYDTTNPVTCNDTFGTRAPSSGGTAFAAGNLTGTFSQNLGGLLPGNTYYVCAIANNSSGTSFGSVVPFSTPPIAPAVTTNAANNVTGSSAQLNGSVNPGGAATTTWFRYSTINPGSCNDTFGTRMPTTGGTSFPAGNTLVYFNQAISGLSQNTTYYFCAIAQNSVGTNFGTIFSFTTPFPPAVTTDTPGGISNNGAVLWGTVNPDGDTTTAWFRYDTINPVSCNDTFGTRTPTTGGTNLGAGTAATNYSASISGLQPLTTYYYCAIASNPEGMGFGAVISFTTQAPPTATTLAQTSLTATGATLNASVTPNGNATTSYFRYDVNSPGTCNTAFGNSTATSSLGAGTSAVSTSANISGLTPATTYYYCVIAYNSWGTAFGQVLSFTTPPAAPSTFTSAQTGLSSSGFTMNGGANPEGAATTGWFRYDTINPGTCNDTFGTRMPLTGGTNLGSGLVTGTMSQILSGLGPPGTTYYYCAIAQNSVGTTFGGIQPVTLAPNPPTVTTNAATLVATTSATLNGSVNPNGGGTTAWFRYDTTNPGTCNDTFGTRAPSSGGTYFPGGNLTGTYSQAISGLLPGVTYYVCTIANNSAGTSFGAVANFSTSPIAPVVSTNFPSGITGTSAQLNGSVNPGGAATTVWFRYDTANPGSCNDTFGTRFPATGGTSIPASNNNVSFTQTPTGLTPGTLYYFCAIGQNSVGTAFGSVLNFTTPNYATVNTLAATPVASTTATLNANATPNGAATTAWFRYDTTNPVSCNDTFGTRVPSTAGATLGSGTTAVSFANGLTGLTPTTTYYFCAIATNLVGTSFGAVLNFTTPATAPTVTASAPSPVSGTTATLTGAAVPNGAATTAWFRYSTTAPGTCNDTFGTRAPATSGSSLGSGVTSVTYSQAITGLSPATTYYVCAIAQNSLGTSVSPLLSFTTPTPPAVTTTAASNVLDISATLNGSSNPNNAATTAWFRYSTTSPGATCNDTFGTKLPAAGISLGAGNTATSFGQAITGLTASTTYYFCAIANNSEGTTLGSVLSFTTLGAPVVTTSPATGVTNVSATLNGSANPNLAATTGYFRYDTINPGSCNDTFGTRAPGTGGATLGSGSSAVSYTQGISGLTPGSTYYVCAIAVNTIATSFGGVVTFTTPAAPAVVTQAASAVSDTLATLNGSANPDLAATTGWFRYSTTSPGASCNDTFGAKAPAAGTTLGSGGAAVAYNQPLTGLLPATTYYFCAVAQNSYGTSFGTVGSFTTLAAPTVTTSAASAITDTAATLNGSANPNLAAATGWFRYSTTSPGTCNDTFGTKAPAAGTGLGTGNTAVAYSQPITGLTAGTKYYFCAIANNSVATGFGGVLSFTTLTAPAVTTSAASAIADTGATLNGSANPNLAATNAWFRYSTTSPGATCNDTFGIRVPTTSGTPLGAGSTAVTYSQSLTGLTAATTYYFCAIAQNSVNTSFGTVLSFTTLAAPTVATSAATGVTDTVATLNGSANPNLAATTGWFRYDVSNPVTCNDTFGTRAPATGGSSLGSGNSPSTYAQALSGLIPGTTYYFCAIANNSVGTSFGSVLTFTTLAAPSVTTSAATGVTDTLATLNGSANPNLAATSAWFRYSTTSPGATCNDTFGTKVPAAGTSLGSGSAPVAYNQPLTGLTPATTYYFCAIAQNSVATSFGSVLSFTTLALPTVATSAASGVADTVATLNGSANPKLAATTAWFRYSTTSPGATCNDTFGTRVPGTGGVSLGSGNASIAYSQAISGLSPATTYYFCAIAQNPVGTSVGNILSFTTLAAPTVASGAATGVTNTAATLNGSANPNLASTTAWFRYDVTSPSSCNDTFGTKAPAAGVSLGAGSSAVNYTQALSGLTPGTTYYFCAIAQNSVGTSLGTVLSFTTLAAPTVTTSAASGVTDTLATLNGSANPNLATTTAWFRYSTTSPGASCNDTFGTKVPAAGTALGAGSSAAAYNQPLSGLSPGTTYYFCAIANNSVGTAFGSILSFTTQAAPSVTTLAASGVVDTSATLNGSANPNLVATIGYFRYSTTSPGATCNDTFGTRTPPTGGAALGSGSASSSYSQAITGLTPGTTYYFCAIANNTIGTSFGGVLSFTTLAVPAVTTSAATAVADTVATLNGSANPNLAATTAWFRYSATSPGATCNDTFGTKVPAAGTALGAGNAAVAYNQPLTGLTPATTYYFCAIAQNSVATSFGSVLTFTTLAAPTVTTSAATAVADTVATLNGSANPNLAATTAWFRYSTTSPGTCNDTFGTKVPAAGTALGSGNAAVAYNQPISGLAPATTYYFCAIAQNSVAMALGGVVSFTTLAAPTVTTAAASAVADTVATLNGSANPNLAATTGYFRYSTTSPGATCNDTFGIRVPTTSGVPLGAGNALVSYSQGLAGLTPATTYYFCAIANNSVATSFGSVLSFTTLAAPVVATSAATAVTDTLATLNGAANPNLAATTAWFRYSTTSPGATCNDTFGTKIPAAGTALGSGNAAVAYNQPLTGLTPATTYYFCAIAQNSVATSFGSVLSFTTLAAPTVITNSATAVADTVATLNGSANPDLAATTAWFRYSATSPGTCNDTFGTKVPTAGTAIGSGNTAVAYNQPLSGLTPATTYYFCAIAQNSVATALGGVVSFTTLAAPSVATSPATGVADTVATLNGSANPNLAATTAWFRYGTTSPGATCNDTFGIRVPTTSGTSLGAGNTSVSYSQGLTGLTPATTYYFCAIANNSVSTSFGAVLTFTTLATPSVTTSAATGVTDTLATLNGSANPNLAATTAWFRYDITNPITCNDTFGTKVPAAGTALGSGNAPASFNQPLTGLTPGTTYYFCAIASNSVGTSLGNVISFTTLAAPSVTTSAAGGVKDTQATLNGSANPNLAATTAWFRYSATSPGASCNDTFGIKVPAAGTALGSANAAVAYNQPLTGLAPATTYYFCAIANNSVGTSFGSVLTFTTLAAPTVTTSAATGVTDTLATLNGSANPNLAATTAWFRYSATNPGATCNDTFGIRVPATGGISLGSGSSIASYSQGVTGLAPATTYYFCAIANNSVGMAFGAVQSFTTLALPTVSTSAASGVADTVGTLHGSANPNLASTSAWFRYDVSNPGSCNDSFGTRVPTTAIGVGSGSAPVSFSQALSGLTPGTTYYFCAIANNSVGTSFGSVLSFTTLAAPTVTTSAATGVTDTLATLNGSANPNLAATTAWFRYSPTSPGTCNDSFGTKVPLAGTALGSLGSAVAYNHPLTGLAPATTYYFCAIANNSVATSFGAVLSFTTLAAPTVTTLAASGVVDTVATLNATANPNLVATTGWFRFSTSNPLTCNDTFGTRAPAVGGISLGSGSSAASYTQGLTGLTPGTTYYVCAVAQNAIGTSVGGVQSFTTLAAPTVTTLAASGVTDKLATLNGSANPNLAATTAWFRYDVTNPGTCNDSFGTRAPTTGGATLGSGNSASPFSQALTGLTPGTTYYFCAIAQNSVGTAFGAVMSLTSQAAPVVTTLPASGITDTLATLNGSANPNLSAATGWFRYDTINPVSCNDSFGTRAPATGGTTLGAGSSAASYSQPLTGLTPGTTYYACAIAQNAIGTSLGAVVTFTTLAAPTVTTGGVTLLTTTSATINGTANPNLSATTGWFRFSSTNPVTCNDTFGTRVPTTSGTPLGSGNTAAPYSQALNGLTPATTYYFCAIAQNTIGTSFGTVQSFSTPDAPAVTTNLPSGVGGTSATLNGTASANFAATTGWFRYDTTNPGTCNDTFGTRAPISGGQALGSSNAPGPYSVTVTTLTPGTTYYTCAVAQNSVGTSFGAVVSFILPAAPAVTTVAVSGVGASSATLNGTANPGLAATTGWFRYSTTNPGSCNDSFGTRAPATGGTSLGSGGTAAPYSQAISGLSLSTTYYFCAIAQNSVGTTFGSVMRFTTPTSPTVTTAAATAITATAATLNGSANPNWDATNGWFRYGTTNPGTCNDTFGTRAPTSSGAPLGAGGTDTSYSNALTGLIPSTTYYVCAIAQNSYGTSFGSVVSFTTLTPPTITTLAASTVTPSGATLNGSGNPQTYGTTGYFRYDVVSPGTCNDTFGTRAPASGGTDLGAGASPVSFAQALTGLSPGTTYYFCAIGSSAAGTSFGSVLAFATVGPPVVTTTAPTNVGLSSATLNGSANPMQDMTAGWFRYATVNPGSCNDTFGTRTPATGGATLGSGGVPVAYAQAITGLTQGTTYYYCAIASNPQGVSFGSVVSFTTGMPAPLVVTDAATDLTGTGATLAGSGNPLGTSATGWFRYSSTDPGSCNDTFGTRVPASGGFPLGSGTAPSSYSAAVTGIQPTTTYYYCAIASNQGGAGFGSIVTFSTALAPIVTTVGGAADGGVVSLKGRGNPNGASTVGWFRYDTSDPGVCNDNFGTRAPVGDGGVPLGAGVSDVPFAQALPPGLTPGTYYFCALASNAQGLGVGALVTVDVPKAAAKSCGCGVGSDANALAALLLLALWQVARVRRKRDRA